MAIEPIRTVHTPAKAVYFTVWDDQIPPNVFDFDDSTFKPLATPAETPFAEAQESADMAGDLSMYVAQLNLMLINPSDLERRFTVQTLEQMGAAPNLITDVFIGSAELVIVAGVHADTKVTLQPGAFDDIDISDPGPPADHDTLPKLIVAIWRAMWKKQTMDREEWLRFADDGTTVNGRAGVSYDGAKQTQGDFQ
jgi:hypothetical protein